MLTTEAERKRMEKRKINNKLGYYTDGFKKFVEGEDWIKLSNALLEKN